MGGGGRRDADVEVRVWLRGGLQDGYSQGVGGGGGGVGGQGGFLV